MILIFTFRHVGKKTVCLLLKKKTLLPLIFNVRGMLHPLCAFIISCCHYSYLKYLPSICTLLRHLIHLWITVLSSPDFAQKYL